MSLDNMLAIAAVCRGHWGLIIIGLSLSIPIIVFCSRLILYLINRFPFIIYAGAGLLAWTASKMIIEDDKVHTFLNLTFNDWLELFNVLIPLAVTAAVIFYGWLTNQTSRKIKNIENAS
jgi:predicted tellurium resistance membrane protein TerC